MQRLRAVLNRMSQKPWLLGLFILCALPAGLMMALLTPVSQTPDGAAHMARAAGLLHGAVIAVRKPETQASGAPLLYTGVKLRGSLFQVGFGSTTAIGDRPAVETQADADATARVHWYPGQVYVDIPNTATYFPAFYLPATAGLAAAYLAGLTPYGCLLTARIFMLAAFLAVGAAAMWLAAFGEALLLTVLLLPMTLFLAGSINPDGILIAAACFATAALTRGMVLLSRHFVLAAGALVLVAMAKLPYAALLGLLLLPLTDLRRRVFVAALAALPVLLWAALLSLYTIAPFGKAPYHPGPLWTGDHNVLFYQTDPAANLRILLARPLRFLSLPYACLRGNAGETARESVGVLGALTLRFPDAFYFAWALAIAAALIGLIFAARPAAQPTARFNWLGSPYVLGLLAVTTWAVAISMYLSWTNVGDAAIIGVQGRYFIPLLPFLAFVVPHWRSLARLPAALWALPAAAMGVFDLGYLPWQFVRFFYLH